MPDCRDQGRAGSCHISIWDEPSTCVPARLTNRGREEGLSLRQQLGGYSISRASKILEGKKRELVKVLKDMRRDFFLGVEFLCLVRLLSCATMANFAITAWFLELQNKMHFCFVFKVDWGKPSHCKVILFFPKQKGTKENGFPGVSWPINQDWFVTSRSKGAIPAKLKNQRKKWEEPFLGVPEKRNVCVA